VDEEDESYEESSCDEDEQEVDGVAESDGSEGESVNPYNEGTLIESLVLIGDFGDGKSVNTKSVKTERTGVTIASTVKSKKRKEVCSRFVFDG